MPIGSSLVNSSLSRTGFDTSLTIDTRACLRLVELFDTVQTVFTGGQAHSLWDTMGMANMQERPQPREDRKVQKLVERIDQKQALQAKAAQEQGQAPSPKADQAQVRSFGVF